MAGDSEDAQTKCIRFFFLLQDSKVLATVINRNPNPPSLKLPNPTFEVSQTSLYSTFASGGRDSPRPQSLKDQIKRR